MKHHNILLIFIFTILFFTIYTICYSSTFSIPNPIPHGTVIKKYRPVGMTDEEFNSLPFDIETEIFKERLGLEIRLKMNNVMKLAGIKDIALGFEFPQCQSIFQFYADFTKWGGEIGKIYRKNINIELPQVCLKDLGVQLPGSQLCAYVDELAIMKRGIFGIVKADITTFKFKFQAQRLFDFTIGEVTKCIKIKDEKQCYQTKTTKGNNCGWCENKNECLELRKDKQGDVCGMCNRCKLYSNEDHENECNWKTSCGWCKSSKTCHPGDQLGPYDYSEECRPKTENDGENMRNLNYRTIKLRNGDSANVSNSWSYINKRCESQKSSYGIGMLFSGSIIGIVIGLLIGTILTFVVTLLGSILVNFVINKIKSKKKQTLYDNNLLES